MSKKKQTPAAMVNGVSVRDLCGWRPDEERIADFAAANGSVFTTAPHLMSTARRDAFLWLAIMQVLPSWRRGAQQIGDCVSWGAELVATCLMCMQHLKGEGKFIAEAATEAIYGGCRVEALGKSRGGRRDGAFGASAAKWMRDWGVHLRVNYTEMTHISEHDLRQYSGQKAKDWGDFGCGGQSDGGKMDTIAKEMPIEQVVQSRTVEEAAASIENGYPMTIASMAGFGDMRRDANGICRIVDEWAHQMAVLGVRWRASEPEFRIFQSWGPKSCSGPDPGIVHPAISGCSWWCTPKDMEWILRTGDCWAFSDLQGMPPQRLDFARPASMWSTKGRDITYEMAI